MQCYTVKSSAARPRRIIAFLTSAVNPFCEPIMAGAPSVVSPLHFSNKRLNLRIAKKRFLKQIFTTGSFKHEFRKQQILLYFKIGIYPSNEDR